MAMSKRSGGEKQEDIWIAQTELAVAPGHPFYKRLNELLEGAGFDEMVEGLCARFYHARLGRPSLRPGIYFRAQRPLPSRQNGSLCRRFQKMPYLRPMKLRSEWQHTRRGLSHALRNYRRNWKQG